MKEQDMRGSQLRKSGNVGFQTPGLSNVNENFATIKKMGKKQDRYGVGDLHSEIAEEDLNLRGPGEFLGQRQSGVPEFVLADLAAHRDLLAIAREQAQIMLTGNGMHHINLLLSLFERDSAVKFLAAG